MTDLPHERIVRIERGTLVGRRPRCCMYNGRMVGPDYIQGHGDTVRDPLVRMMSTAGPEGCAHPRLSHQGAEASVGRSLSDLVRPPHGCPEADRPVDRPRWDLAARMAGLPLYRLLGG